ncbi:MAG: DUF2158 domain-containing protein [Myxococcales bacterium]|nr:DUF2158 domain-containing protein [Myxococcales bacterium]
MADQIKKGDTVQLKSGGPPMTVEEVDGDEIVCVWFDHKNQLERSVFQVATLTKASGSIGIGVV